MIVADTNLIAYVLLPGEWSAQALKVLDADPEWAAPPLWQSEFRNILAQAVRRKEMTLAEARKVWGAALERMEGGEASADGERVLELAAESGCSAYDCEFVALALELGVPLVTSDAQVLDAFPRIAIPMGEFGG